MNASILINAASSPLAASPAMVSPLGLVQSAQVSSWAKLATSSVLPAVKNRPALKHSETVFIAGIALDRLPTSVANTAAWSAR